MYKKLIIAAVLFMLFLTSCSGEKSAIPASSPEPAASAEPTPTIDPCLPQSKRALAEKMHRHMREFDDASALAASLDKDSLPPQISELQRIRRAAEDEQVPACLSELKSLQINHMNAVINTLIAFLNSAGPETLQSGIQEARSLHDAYILELASVMGVTVIAQPTPTQDTATQPPETATGTPAADLPPEPSTLTASNPGQNTVNLRSDPNFNAKVLAQFDLGATAVVLGKSTDGQWVQVEVPGRPGEKGWLFVQAVTLSGQLDNVAVISP